MNEKETNRAVASVLGGRHMPRNELLKEVEKIKSIAQQDTAIAIERMRGEGLMDSVEHSTIWDGGERIYMTKRGLKEHSPFLVKIMEYLAKNWIAIAALILSLIALFKR